MLTVDELKQAFISQDLTSEESMYLDEHSKRLTYMVNLIQEYQSVFNIKTILDIGPHFLTSCIKKFIKPEVSVSTLGWANERLVPSSIIDKHFQFDLNRSAERSLTLTSDRFDLIVFSETVEHLYTSPTHVMRFLKNLMKIKNGVLVIQTPNAVCLTKRIKMLFGINPFELITENSNNPGHFREYTMNELISYGKQAKLKVYRKEFCDYWQSHFLPMRILEATHSSFKKGITITFLS